MDEMEIVTRSREFAGPAEDLWPSGSRWRTYATAAKYEPSGDHEYELASMRRQYEVWRTSEEQALLSAFGRAGFELVKITEDRRSGAGGEEIISVRAYFQRYTDPANPPIPGIWD